MENKAGMDHVEKISVRQSVTQTALTGEAANEKKKRLHKLIDAESASFSNGIIITSTHMAKGIEFDKVIVPDADNSNFKTEIDKGLLYIACTRAMHELEILHTKTRTYFIDNETN